MSSDLIEVKNLGTWYLGEECRGAQTGVSAKALWPVHLSNSKEASVLEGVRKGERGR